jgi:hypothetical protein
MLTKDERALMVATICLHGFALYERFGSDGVWRPLLAGKFVENKGGTVLFEMIEQWKKDDQIADRRGKVGIDHKRQPMHWFKLTDEQLAAFHHTVISTC